MVDQTSNPQTAASKPTMAWYQPYRGVTWLLVGVLGAIIVGHLPGWGVDPYTQRWIGACFKVATGGWGGYRISRDIARLDPTSISEPTASAIQHLARAFIMGMAIIGVCLAV